LLVVTVLSCPVSLAIGSFGGMRLEAMSRR
jgi:hypothetical protein